MKNRFLFLLVMFVLGLTTAYSLTNKKNKVYMAVLVSYNDELDSIWSDPHEPKYDTYFELNWPQKEIIKTCESIDGKTKNLIIKYKVIGFAEKKETDDYFMKKYVVSNENNRRFFFTITVENTRITFTIEDIDRLAKYIPLSRVKYVVSEVVYLDIK